MAAKEGYVPAVIKTKTKTTEKVELGPVVRDKPRLVREDRLTGQHPLHLASHQLPKMTRG